MEVQSTGGPASAKRALYGILDERGLTDEVLITALTQAESLINSRPLRYMSNDPGDPEPLISNHFLIGRASPNLPPDVFVEVELSSRKHWRHAQAIASHFWNRCMKEYMTTLTERQMDTTPTQPVGERHCSGAGHQPSPRNMEAGSRSTPVPFSRRRDQLIHSCYQTEMCPWTGPEPAMFRKAVMRSALRRSDNAASSRQNTYRIRAHDSTD